MTTCEFQLRFLQLPWTRQSLEIPALVTLDEPFNSFWPKFLSREAGGREGRKIEDNFYHSIISSSSKFSKHVLSVLKNLLLSLQIIAYKSLLVACDKFSTFPYVNIISNNIWCKPLSLKYKAHNHNWESVLKHQNYLPEQVK